MISIDNSPRITVIEYMHPFPENITQMYGAFPDSYEGYEAAEKVLAACCATRREGFGHRIAYIDEAIKLMQQHFNCLIEVAVENDLANTPVGLADAFLKINEAVRILEIPEETTDDHREEMSLIALSATERLSALSNQSAGLNQGNRFESKDRKAALAVEVL
ncbi:hypothetical protein OAG71_02545 [bacterium]|nr:hypothetical protein [bacterium]